MTTPRLHSSVSMPWFNPQCAKKLMKAADYVKCQGCYSPISLGKVLLAKPHPCLFCSECLKTVTFTGKEKYTRHGMVKVNSFGSSQDSDITAWDKSAGKNHYGGFGNLKCQEVLLNSSLKSNSTSSRQQVPKVPTRHRDSTKTGFNREMFQEKLKDLEIRATRCGYCVPWQKKRKLVTFCVQCKKYICKQHSLFHEKSRYTKLHGTVNLTRMPNDALL